MNAESLQWLKRELPRLEGQLREGKRGVRQRIAAELEQRGMMLVVEKQWVFRPYPCRHVRLYYIPSQGRYRALAQNEFYPGHMVHGIVGKTYNTCYHEHRALATGDLVEFGDRALMFISCQDLVGTVYLWGDYYVATYIGERRGWEWS